MGGLGKVWERFPYEEKEKAASVGGFVLPWGYQWWRRRESNPRPQVLHSQDYMLSLAIWVSPRARRPAG